MHIFPFCEFGKKLQRTTYNLSIFSTLRPIVLNANRHFEIKREMNTKKREIKKIR